MERPVQDVSVTPATAARRHHKHRAATSRSSSLLQQCPGTVQVLMTSARCTDGCCRSPVYKLAGVKHTLYNPCLPSLRRMEMDTMGHKLSDHHSRTSTPCTHERFSNPRVTTSDPPEYQLPSLEATHTGKQFTQRYGIDKGAAQSPGMTQPANDWYRYRPSYGEPPLQGLQHYVLGYSGHTMRFLPPKLTRPWKYCLQQSPALDHHGQKPLPVETINTFRNFGLSYRSSAYLRPWH